MKPDFLDFLEGTLSGKYPVPDPLALAEGRKASPIWGGWKTDVSLVARFFKHCSADPSGFHRKIIDTLKLYRIFVIPLEGDEETREQVALGLYQQISNGPGKAAALLEAGNDQREAEAPSVSCRFTSPPPVVGLEEDQGQSEAKE